MKSMGANSSLMIAISFSLILSVFATPIQAQELTWEQINVSGFGMSNTRVSGMTVFDESLYAGTINQTDGAQVWRFDSGTTWTQVNDDGFAMNNMAVQGIVVFNGELYIGTTNFSEGCQVWRYDGGTSWTQVNESGFENGKEACVARVLIVFDGQLYAGVRNDTDIGGMVGAQVWRFDGSTSWTQINEDGFGNEPSGNNRSVESMAVLDGNLYSGTWNDVDGCQVWRYDSGTSWTQVNENAFGNMPSGGYSVSLSMEVFNGNLYVGTRNDEDGTEVWRYESSTDWTQVNETGFGSTNNYAIWSLAVHNDSLFAGTMNMGGGGGQVWRYESGASWTQVNAGGFGNSTNSMITDMVVYNGELCAGTHNTTDYCQVWITENTSSVTTNPVITPILEQNYPNPFNLNTTISYQLQMPASVSIRVYDINGKLIDTLVDEEKDSGLHSVFWNAEGISPSLYFYRIVAGEMTEIRSCISL